MKTKSTGRSDFWGSLWVFVGVSTGAWFVYASHWIALFLGMVAALIARPLVTGRVHIGGGQGRGRDSLWYWFLLVGLVVVLVTFAIGAPKRIY